MDDVELIPHVLACDVGNTSVHFAHVHGETVTPVQTIRIGELSLLSSAVEELWQSMPSPRVIAACSVNPAALKAVEAAILESIQQEVLVVGRDLPLPMETDLNEPQAIGTDRICAAVAAYDRLGRACVVGDFGTAITIDCVSEEGIFLGGAILPGLSLSAACLSQGTAQLPQVTLRQPDWVYGKNTEQAITGGLVYGARGALRELSEAYATQLGGWPLVIITGGDAELICPHPGDDGLVQAIVPDLVLRGVAAAYYRTLVT